ncbi:hypothetical protein FB451DRAFT_1177069 [Mycena latifolia]|nr:hypothetical protein FB451DRAFT_1177069 [Mycena latifolia]
MHKSRMQLCAALHILSILIETEAHALTPASPPLISSFPPSPSPPTNGVGRSRLACRGRGRPAASGMLGRPAASKARSAGVEARREAVRPSRAAICTVRCRWHACGGHRGRQVGSRRRSGGSGGGSVERRVGVEPVRGEDDRGRDGDPALLVAELRDADGCPIGQRPSVSAGC